MNPYKVSRLQLSARHISVNSESQKPLNYKKTDVESSFLMVSETNKNKTDLVQSQKNSYVNLCSQLKRENNLLSRVNKIHIKQTESLQQEVRKLQIQYQNIVKKSKQQRVKLKQQSYHLLKQMNQQKQYMSIDPQIQNLKQYLQQLTVSQYQEYKFLRNKYKTIQNQILTVKSTIDKNETVRLNKGQRTFA